MSDPSWSLWVTGPPQRFPLFHPTWAGAVVGGCCSVPNHLQGVGGVPDRSRVRDWDFYESCVGAVPQPWCDSERGARVPGRKQLEGVTDSITRLTLIRRCF